jgi:archaellum component FlaC
MNKLGLFKRNIKEDIECLQTEFKDLNELFYRLSNKVNDLFERDRHGTLRPKVDLLDDKFDKFERDVWNHFRMLQEKIEKLEKIEVDDLSEKTER